MPELHSRMRVTLWRAGRSSSLLMLVAAGLMIAGCKPVGPNYNRPAVTAPANYKEIGATSVTPPPNPQGGNWKPASPSDGLLKGNWWEVYQDPQLNSFEQRVTSDNFEIKQALSNYLAAR